MDRKGFEAIQGPTIGSRDKSQRNRIECSGCHHLCNNSELARSGDIIFLRESSVGKSALTKEITSLYHNLI